MRPVDLKELIRVHLKQGSGLNELGSLYIEGPPGVGKSDVVLQVTEEEGAGCVDFRLLLRDPTDLRGIPFPDLTNNTARWLPPSELPGNNSLPTGILFLDDMPTAPPLVQAAAYQLAIKPHKIGEYSLPEGWIVVGAGNKSSDRSLVHSMPKALANRFRHIQYELNKDDWVDWALKNNVNPRIVGFISSPAADTQKGNLLFQFDPGKEEKAFPTPRSWVSASKLLEANLSVKIMREALGGTVGEAAAVQFHTFERLFDKLPDPDEILVKKNFACTPEAMDLKYALVVSIAQRTAAKQVDNAIMWAVEFLPPELGVLLIKMLSVKHTAVLIKSPSFVKWAKSNRDVLT